MVVVEEDGGDGLRASDTTDGRTETLPRAADVEVPSSKCDMIVVPPGALAVEESEAATLDADCMSTLSDLECPVCYQVYCEPVYAGCGRHVFCRHCLWKTWQRGDSLRCPICRVASKEEVQDLSEVASLVERLRRKDPSYDGRAELAVAERKRDVQAREALRSLSLSDWGAPSASWQFQVSGAGCEEANGIYVVDVLPAYMGPTVFRKPNTFFFIFRWHRTQWVIAELRRQSRMGNERTWLYAAPTQSPPDVPPASGWEVPRHGHAAPPAPQVRLAVTLQAQQGEQRAQQQAQQQSGQPQQQPQQQQTQPQQQPSNRWRSSFIVFGSPSLSPRQPSGAEEAPSPQARTPDEEHSSSGNHVRAAASAEASPRPPTALPPLPDDVAPATGCHPCSVM
eukprot:TRINITY_DN2880_c0_g1_i1.p1 TRINITY_DN2880_c0_g1~~TRINITY_DN2880_c0_g1_i1.p1  ORF type:complete len:395 (+),score=96.78 TRINITY_DN2880_c0_g1_i1:125-1309(+)